MSYYVRYNPQDGTFDRPKRSFVRDNLGAWARPAGGVPRRKRRTVQCRSRTTHRAITADRVAVDLHAGATRLSQARRQRALSTRPRRARNGLSITGGAESP